ncbi:MAG TPA: C25 family cysteine peptidase, partial [Polyangiaceae bacterium]
MNHLRAALHLGVVGALAALQGCSQDAGKPATPAATDYVIITADTLAASAGRWRDWRANGHVVELALASKVVADKTAQADVTAAIHDWIKVRFAARDAKKPFFVLVVGDANGGTVGPDVVPVASQPAAAGPVDTDNSYADMDGDGIPDLAIGRIPVRSDADVDLVRGKIAAYEASYPVGKPARRINLFASTSGFGEPADTLIEALVFKIVEEVPYEYDITMTYAKQDSPYVFVPERFSDKVYERINEGALMVTYVGHGYQEGFASLQWGNASFPILDTTQLSKITSAPKAPLLTLIACATGAFATGDSVSEQILRGAGGPVAVLSSTENSHP